MPEQEPILSEDATAAEDFPETGGRSSIFAKIKVLLLLAVVITAECVAAYVFLPSTTQTRILAEDTLGIASEDGDLSSEDGEDADRDIADQVELDLGEFSVTAFHPISSTTMRIDFLLYGMVAEGDVDEFLERLDGQRHRFREQVIVTLRGADITDLTDPTLGLIKRRVLERTNRTLGKPLLRGVIFSEFSFLEQ